MTGTFKQLKVKLMEQGFDPEHIQDPLYILDDRVKSYMPLTTELYSAIVSGNIKLWAGLPVFFYQCMLLSLAKVILNNELTAQGQNSLFVIHMI